MKARINPLTKGCLEIINYKSLRTHFEINFYKSCLGIEKRGYYNQIRKEIAYYLNGFKVYSPKYYFEFNKREL